MPDCRIDRASGKGHCGHWSAALHYAAQRLWCAQCCPDCNPAPVERELMEKPIGEQGGLFE